MRKFTEEFLLQMPQCGSDSVGVSRSECANIANKGVGDITQEGSMGHPLNEPWWGHVAHNWRSPLHARHTKHISIIQDMCVTLEIVSRSRALANTNHRAMKLRRRLNGCDDPLVSR
jgi:hypothetical protein